MATIHAAVMAARAVPSPSICMPAARWLLAGAERGVPARCGPRRRARACPGADRRQPAAGDAAAAGRGQQAAAAAVFGRRHAARRPQGVRVAQMQSAVTTVQHAARAAMQQRQHAACCLHASVITGACTHASLQSPALLRSVGRLLARIDDALASFSHPGVRPTHDWSLAHVADAVHTFGHHLAGEPRRRCACVLCCMQHLNRHAVTAAIAGRCASHVRLCVLRVLHRPAGRRPTRLQACSRSWCWQMTRSCASR